ncbi:hypothetical protein PR048_011727 [Dryococelus australis]|uniref:Uncharacterized protein n=1 Tax=Dryococelus australis TaxID=614101 RepID=A0ABQ9HME8_9NEOP|nr:hypothetical protein PR048_011727 [Dryococelus australis]
MENTCFTYEKLVMLVNQIEACLNSKPLLTPGHFLIGTAITNICEPHLNYVKLGLFSRWQLFQDKLTVLTQKVKGVIEPSSTKGKMDIICKHKGCQLSGVKRR